MSARLQRFTYLILFIPLLALLSSCSDDTPPQPSSSTLDRIYTETGDFKQVSRHGKLRILSIHQDQIWLPRQGHSFDNERELAILFAQQHKLEPVFIYVDRFEQLLPALKTGKGDIAIANLAVTKERKQQVEFSVPITHTREYIVTRRGEVIKNASQLNNRSLAVRATTTHENSARELQQRTKTIKIKILDGHLKEDDILDQLNNKKFDATIMDDNRLQIISSYRNDFSRGMTASKERAIAWAIRPDTPELADRINLFLTNHHLTQKSQTFHTDDLDKIRQRKTLRMLTRNNAANYFLWRGELLGFEYELAKKFAQENGLRLEVITAPGHDALIPMLLEGKGDFIASFMSISESRKQQGVQFTRAHHRSQHIIISRSNGKIISTLDDLKGRTFYVRRSSAYWETLQNLKNQGYQFSIKAAEETMETEEIIDNVARGRFDLTVADSHILDIELTWRDDIRGDMMIGKEQQNAWVMRSDNTQLINAANKFLKKNHRSLFYNVLYNKYFVDSHKINEMRSERIGKSKNGAFSPYDNIVKKYAQQYHFDWRLIIAQMYQESRFEPDAKSWAGAKGLMQVMPRTAKELGIKDLKKPENGIRAGVMYLDWVRDRFEPELNVKDRTWFALAAYNAGHGHVRDARRLARKLGHNPNKWFDNVEKAMLLLSRKKYAKDARHGYVRGSEPVEYVRNIRKRYYAYLAIDD